MILTRATADEPLRHRFLALDESRQQLLYVDETNPAADWAVKLRDRYRDLQLIGARRVLLSATSGYEEWDLDRHALVKEHADPRLAGTATVRRLADGRTLVGCNQKGITFYELGPDDAIGRTVNLPALNTLRLARLTARGTLLFGANTTKVFEADWNGIVKEREIAGSQHNYMTLEKPDGHLLVSAGYAGFLAETDAAGRELRRWGGKPEPAALSLLRRLPGAAQRPRRGGQLDGSWRGRQRARRSASRVRRRGPRGVAVA
jgi:hypothetical protein